MASPYFRLSNTRPTHPRARLAHTHTYTSTHRAPDRPPARPSLRCHTTYVITSCATQICDFSVLSSPNLCDRLHTHHFSVIFYPRLRDDFFSWLAWLLSLAFHVRRVWAGKARRRLRFASAFAGLLAHTHTLWMCIWLAVVALCESPPSFIFDQLDGSEHWSQLALRPIESIHLI